MGYEDDLASGVGGLEALNGAMEGNLGKWAEGYTIEQSANRRRSADYERARGRGPSIPAAVLVAAVVLIALLVMFH